MSTRIADSLLVLRDEINQRWPERDTSSDCAYGDTSHQHNGSSSDHNPWLKDPDGVGVVRALDTDVDGINAAWLAEHFRSLGSKGDARLSVGGYVIYNRRIASERDDWAWRTYTGSNPHTSHIHVSVSRDQTPGYDSHGDWSIADPFEGYTDNEKASIREYDELLREGRNLARRRQLRREMTAQRKRIWHIAQPVAAGGDGKGWDYGRRRARYRSLLARTQ